MNSPHKGPSCLRNTYRFNCLLYVKVEFQFLAAYSNRSLINVISCNVRQLRTGMYVYVYIYIVYILTQ